MGWRRGFGRQPHAGERPGSDPVSGRGHGLQGTDLPESVLPFILRNVTHAGIDSVNAPHESRVEAWSRLACDQELSKLARTTEVVDLADVPVVAARMLEGKV